MATKISRMFPLMTECKHFLFIIFIVTNTPCIYPTVECLESTFTFNLPKASWDGYPIILMSVYRLRKVFKVIGLVFKSRVFD